MEVMIYHIKLGREKYIVVFALEDITTHGKNLYR